MRSTFPHWPALPSSLLPSSCWCLLFWRAAGRWFPRAARPLAEPELACIVMQDGPYFFQAGVACGKAPLRHIGRAATAATEFRHGVLHQLSHIEVLTRTLRKYQRGLAGSRSQKRNDVAGAGGQFLRQQFNKNSVALRKAMNHYAR